MPKRVVENENTKVVTGKSGASSSHKALSYNLISPHTINKLATRLSVGAQKYGSVQWRIGINDAEYVADRFNHTVEHLMKFMHEGQAEDDNLAAILWGVNALCEVERLAPDAFKHIVGITNKFGESAREFHEQEMKDRESK